MIVCYAKLSDKEILKQAKAAKKQIAQWFKDNPTRKTCRTELWYGKTAIIKPSSIDTTVDRIAKEAIKG